MQQPGQRDSVHADAMRLDDRPDGIDDVEDVFLVDRREILTLYRRSDYAERKEIGGKIAGFACNCGR
jgi:hypothetical protein